MKNSLELCIARVCFSLEMFAKQLFLSRLFLSSSVCSTFSHTSAIICEKNPSRLSRIYFHYFSDARSRSQISAENYFYSFFSVFPDAAHFHVMMNESFGDIFCGVVRLKRWKLSREKKFFGGKFMSQGELWAKIFSLLRWLERLLQELNYSLPTLLRHNFEM